jgi:hypothetical protein
MDNTKHAIATLSAVVNTNTNELLITFKEQGGSQFTVGIHSGMAPNLAVTLFTLGASASKRMSADW